MNSSRRTLPALRHDLADPSLKYPTPSEVSWLGELTEVERTVLGVAPPAVVRSDGKDSWLDHEKDVGSYHPATLIADPTCDETRLMDYYLWDLCGYLILRNGMGVRHEHMVVISITLVALLNLLSTQNH